MRRLFWAIELPQAIRGRLVELLAELKEIVPYAALRWVNPESAQLHITVKFLGPTPEPDGVIEVTRALCQGLGPFTLELGALGCFGGRQPRVFWLGLGGPGLEALKALGNSLSQAHEALGFETEKRAYNPHITLGRAKGRGRGKRAAREALAELKALMEQRPALEAEPFEVRELVLYESLKIERQIHYQPFERLVFSG